MNNLPTKTVNEVIDMAIQALRTGEQVEEVVEWLQAMKGLFRDMYNEGDEVKNDSV